MGMCRVALIGSTLAVAMTSIGHAAPPSTPDTAALASRVEALKKKVLADLVFVKGGSFEMGDFGPSRSEEKLPYTSSTDDDIVRKVKLGDYALLAHKVSYHDFSIFALVSGLPKAASGDPAGGLVDRPDAPAGVSWGEAQQYCRWIGKQIGRRMDLPTEAQWEYAARDRGKFVLWATDNGKIDEGRNVASMEQLDEYREQHAGATTLPVGQFPATPLGLYDMIDHGYEWMLDWYAEDYDRNDLEDPQGPKDGSEKVRRSSSDVGAGQLAITSMTIQRSKAPPEGSTLKLPWKKTTTIDNSGNGFRCIAL